MTRDMDLRTPPREILIGGITLRTNGNGIASWDKLGDGNSQLRYSDWVAKLTGGVQEGSDWAAVHIPINDLPVPDMVELIYRYYFPENAQANGLHVCFATYNPSNHLERAEITIDAAEVSKDVGWNVQSIIPATDDFFWYGDNIVPDLEEGILKQYTWAEFQADKVFKTHVIYMIKLEWGYWGEGTAADCYVSGVQLNGVKIPIEPSLNEQLDLIRADLPHSYAFSIGGIHFDDYSQVKTLTLDAMAQIGDEKTLHLDGVDYVVPTGKVFIAFQACIWMISDSTIGRIGESDAADDTITKEVIKVSNGTNTPFVTYVNGVFSADKYITASSDSSEMPMLVGSVLYGIEIDA